MREEFAMKCACLVLMFFVTLTGVAQVVPARASTAIPLDPATPTLAVPVPAQNAAGQPAGVTNSLAVLAAALSNLQIAAEQALPVLAGFNDNFEFVPASEG